MPKVTRCPVFLLCLGVAAGGWGASGLAQDAPASSDAAAEEDVDVIPPQIILKTQKAPEYPPAAFKARFSGEVTLEVTVLRDGTVADEVRIVECTHTKVGFEQAAIEAVKKWRFEPATADGAPVAFTRMFRLTFHGTGAGAEIGPYVTSGSVPKSDGTTDTAVTTSRDSTAGTQRK